MVDLYAPEMDEVVTSREMLLDASADMEYLFSVWGGDIHVPRWLWVAARGVISPADAFDSFCVDPLSTTWRTLPLSNQRARLISYVMKMASPRRKYIRAVLNKIVNDNGAMSW